MKLIPLCIDTETTLIGANGTPVPDLICASFAVRVEGKIQSALYGNGDDLEAALLEVIEDPQYLLLGHNLGMFDCGVIVKKYPNLMVPMLKAGEAGRLDDTMIRQKLMMLSAYGAIKNYYAPDGSKVVFRYSLAHLEGKYLGTDRSDQKQGEDIWRLRYGELDGMKAEDYPQEAYDYALEDAEECLKVWEQQQIRCASDERYCCDSSEFQTESAFHLSLITRTGMAVDEANVKFMSEEVDRLRGPDSAAYKALVASGALNPSTPERPQISWKTLNDKGKMVKVKNSELPAGLPMFPEEGEPVSLQFESDEVVYEVDFVPTFTRTKDKEVKMVNAKKASKSTKVIVKLAVDAWKKTFPDKLMPTTDKGAPSVTAEVRGKIKKNCEVISALDEYEILNKIATNQIPAMLLAVEGGRMYFGYDVLKETGRTSSKDRGMINKKRVFASASGQQVPDLIGACDPRRTYVPGKGKALIASDYDSMELACFGQVCFEMLGYSDHMDRYNKGHDLHAVFAVDQLMEDGSEDEHVLQFQEAAKGMSTEEQYALFKSLQECGEVGQEFYKFRRKSAKPFTLGSPGGVGPATMVDIAAGYGIVITQDQAKATQKLHRVTFREMTPYFKKIQRNVDPFNVDQKGRNLYWFRSHMGMLVRARGYTQVANARGMQTPGAECIKLAQRLIWREMLDESLDSVLFGCRLVNTIHDELLAETTTDQSKWAAQAERISELMVKAARMILKDVFVTSEACLMSVWTKKAKPTFDESGKLIVWHPKPSTKTNQ